MILTLGDANELARMCKRWYEPMRRQLLEECDWTFARKTFTLNLIGEMVGTEEFPDWAQASDGDDDEDDESNNVTTDNAVFPWAYLYAYPANVLFVHKVYNKQSPNFWNEWSGYAGSAATTDFRTWLQGQNAGWELIRSRKTNEYAIATNIQNAICKYTSDMRDTSQFSTAFAIALSLKIAQRICLPLTGDQELRAQIDADLEREMTKAYRLNLSENPEHGPTTSSYEDVRGM